MGTNVRNVPSTIIFKSVFKNLINSGADLNQVTEYGVTPLSLAAKYGFSDVFEELIKAGADVEASIKSEQDKGNFDAAALIEKVYAELVEESESVGQHTDVGDTQYDMGPLHSERGSEDAYNYDV